MMSDTSHEYWRQLDERGRQQIGHDQRPGAGHRVGSAAHQLQAPIEYVEPRVFCGGAQRLGIEVEAKRSRHAHQQRRQRQHTRPGPHVEQRAGRRGLEDLFDRFEAHRCRRVQSRSERRRVGQPQDAGFRVGVSRNDPQAPGASRARAQGPDRSGVAADGR
jgi:hypothetical protein